MGAWQIVHLPEKKKEKKIWPLSESQIVHFSEEKKRGVKWIVQVAIPLI